MTIRIPKTHLELMKKQLSRRLIRIQKKWRDDVEAEMWCNLEEDHIPDITNEDMLRELDRTCKLLDQLNYYLYYLEVINLDVNCTSWFNEWFFVDIINDESFDMCYMFPEFERTNILLHLLREQVKDNNKTLGEPVLRYEMAGEMEICFIPFQQNKI